MAKVTFSGLALKDISQIHRGCLAHEAPGKGKELIEKHSPSKQIWECATWNIDTLPPVAAGFEYVSIEVEARLESGKIVPAVYTRAYGCWYLAEGKYPRIQEKVIGWREKHDRDH